MKTVEASSKNVSLKRSAPTLSEGKRKAPGRVKWFGTDQTPKVDGFPKYSSRGLNKRR
jgi:hypothetical protein